MLQVINTSTVCLMGHERRLTLGLIAGMAQTLLDRRAVLKADSLRLGALPSNSCYAPSTTGTHSNGSPHSPTICTLIDQDLVIDQVYYGPFCCPPVFYPNPSSDQFYAVYTYEYGSPPSPPCCDVTVTSSSESSSSSCCCPYCETCPECVSAASDL